MILWSRNNIIIIIIITIYFRHVAHREKRIAYRQKHTQKVQKLNYNSELSLPIVDSAKIRR